jgi:hypothetical protein
MAGADCGSAKAVRLCNGGRHGNRRLEGEIPGATVFNCPTLAEAYKVVAVQRLEQTLIFSAAAA